MRRINRYQLIRKLVQKEYKKKRPNATEMMAVINKYDLQLHKSDGRKRSREAMTKAVAKAFKSLQ